MSYNNAEIEARRISEVNKRQETEELRKKENCAVSKSERKNDRERERERERDRKRERERERESAGEEGFISRFIIEHDALVGTDQTFQRALPPWLTNSSSNFDDLFDVALELLVIFK